MTIRPTESDALLSHTPTHSIADWLSTLPPRNAWLFIDADAGVVTPEALRAQRHPSEPRFARWAAPSHVQAGDLVFLYFRKPHGTVPYVARARSGAIYDATIGDRPTRTLGAGPWTVELGPFVDIEPLTFGALRAAHGGHLILQNRPTSYLTPTVVDRLVDDLGPLDVEQRTVLQRPTGNPELPDPSTMTLGQLRDVAAGALKLEWMVDRFIVEPLLRLLVDPRGGLRIERHVAVRRAGTADSCVLRDDVISVVVQATLGLRFRHDDQIESSPDLHELARLCRASGSPGLLIDANTIYVTTADGEPVAGFDRAMLSTDDLADIRDCVGGALTR